MHLPPLTHVLRWYLFNALNLLSLYLETEVCPCSSSEKHLCAANFGPVLEVQGPSPLVAAATAQSSYAFPLETLMTFVSYTQHRHSRYGLLWLLSITGDELYNIASNREMIREGKGSHPANELRLMQCSVMRVM